MIPVPTVRGVATHKEDDIELATAVSGNAAYLVNGDRGLLRLSAFAGITIVSPGDYLAVLEEQEMAEG